MQTCLSYDLITYWNYKLRKVVKQQIQYIMNLEKRIQNQSNLSTAFGLITKSGPYSFTPLKLALDPYLINQLLYTELAEITRVWQKLLYLASKDIDFVKKTFHEAAQVDDLIHNVYKIFLKSFQNPKQDSLIFARVDYFKNTKDQFKIIEYNMTAVSMHAHSENLLAAYKMIDFLQQPNHQFSYPHNTPCSDIAEAVAEMYKLKGLKGVFLMVVSINQRNVIDQTNLQVKLLEKGIKIKRQSLCRLYSLIEIKQNKIFINGQEISMVYYRAGYHPKDYCETGSFEECWKARQMIELSDAIKIPDIKMELMNHKRMQVELSKQEVYSKYLTHQESSILQKSLVYTTDFDQKAQKIDILNLLQQRGKQKFILKPNLQGGGNNIYGQKVYETLKNISQQERKKYILMEKIQTKSVENTLFHGSQYETLKCICEISRYGFIMQVNNNLVKNFIDGYLIRIKPQTFDEGGVIAGFGALGVMAFQK